MPKLLLRYALGFLAVGFLTAPLWAGAPDPAAQWLVYGNGLAAQNRLEDAAQAYSQGLKAAPQDADLYGARGLVWWRLGRRDQALADLRQSLALNPDQAALAAWLGRFGGSATAGAVSQDDLDDQLSDAQGALEARDLARALNLFEQGAAEAPGDAAWARGEAETYYAEGRFDDARKALGSALALAPTDPDLQRLKARYFPDGLDTDHSQGSVWGALWRSTILPGWGQAYNRQHTKAWIVGFLTLGLLAATAATYVATDSAIAHYRALGPGSDFNAAFSDAYDLAVANEVVGIGFYSVYAWNILDAGTHVPAPLPAPAPQALAPGGPRLTLLAFKF